MAQFDQISAGTTALNAVNAIRAVTSSLSQSASSLPSGVTAETEDAAIVFPRPAGRIVKGATRWRNKFPKNRLVAHLSGCALASCCPAANRA